MRNFCFLIDRLNFVVKIIIKFVVMIFCKMCVFFYLYVNQHFRFNFYCFRRDRY